MLACLVTRAQCMCVLITDFDTFWSCTLLGAPVTFDSFHAPSIGMADQRLSVCGGRFSPPSGLWWRTSLCAFWCCSVLGLLLVVGQKNGHRAVVHSGLPRMRVIGYVLLVTHPGNNRIAPPTSVYQTHLFEAHLLEGFGTISSTA